ncbi:hypothetical protein A4E84_19060 [Streptomyces qaidamensis]|uniref:Uncharacterized protein n=1 Tax=Streptomyces qaidamensis TaxID=1783515 RepID=A0A143C1Q1_9ACTN|nr:hypothetical protein A4E84_19060 [Streptomyces qaidamensis]
MSGCAGGQRGLFSRRLLSQGSPPQACPLCGIEGVGETVEAVGKFPEPIRVCREGVREAAQVVGTMRMPVAIHLDVHEGDMTGWALGEGALFEARAQNHRRAAAR